MRSNLLRVRADNREEGIDGRVETLDLTEAGLGQVCGGKFSLGEGGSGLSQGQGGYIHALDYILPHIWRMRKIPPCGLHYNCGRQKETE